MINSETRKKMNRKKDKEGIRKKAKKESKTEEAMKSIKLFLKQFTLIWPNLMLKFCYKSRVFLF